MGYIKKIAALAITVVISVSGFSAIAQEAKDGALKAPKFEFRGEKKDFKGEKKNFKRPQRKKVKFTEEEKAAKLEEQKAKLAEDLASGKLTQEQYDKMISALNEGKFPGFGNFGKAPQRKKVELTEEEKAAKLEEQKAKLAEDLASGKITQEQYDKMITALNEGKFPNFKRPNHGMKRNLKRPNKSFEAKEKAKAE